MTLKFTFKPVKEKQKRKHTKEAIRKLREAGKRRKHSEKTKIKMSKAHRGERNHFYGKEHSEKTKRKISEAVKGEKSPHWKGGISKILYPFEFNRKLKYKIRKRDNFKCIWCGKTEEEEFNEFHSVLSVNHIDHDKTNNDERNLITLCCVCNSKEIYYPNMKKFFENYINYREKQQSTADIIFNMVLVETN